MVASNTDLLSVTQSFSSPNRELHCVKSARIRSSSCPYFPAFRLNTERYCPNAGKYGQKKLQIQTLFPQCYEGALFLKYTFVDVFFSNALLRTFFVKYTFADVFSFVQESQSLISRVSELKRKECCPLNQVFTVQ